MGEEEGVKEKEKKEEREREEEKRGKKRNRRIKFVLARVVDHVVHTQLKRNSFSLLNNYSALPDTTQSKLTTIQTQISAGKPFPLCSLCKATHFLVPHYAVVSYHK